MFLFQPAEEDFTGAKAMIEDGVFAKLKPEAVFALHVVPFPAGILATKPGAMFACRARLIIQLKEVGEEKEALGVVAGLLQELNTPPGVNVSSLSPAEAGQGISRPESVLGNYFTLAGAPRIERQATGGCTVRVQAVASSIDNLDTAVRRLERSIGDSKLKESVTSVSFELMQPVVNNDPNLAQESAEIVRATAGESAFVPLYGVTPGFNDDFAFFLKEARGVYFFLGGSNPEKGIVSMPHTSDFAVEEACIGAGVARISSLLFELARRWPEVKAETEQKMRLK
jgi:metal-dependent amidase/aminoacylase/carboxypeptidase family protein